MGMEFGLNLYLRFYEAGNEISQQDIDNLILSMCKQYREAQNNQGGQRNY